MFSSFCVNSCFFVSNISLVLMKDGSEFFISSTLSFDFEISLTDTEPELIPVIIESSIFFIPDKFVI